MGFKGYDDVCPNRTGEPVAWRYYLKNQDVWVLSEDAQEISELQAEFPDVPVTPLYAAPDPEQARLREPVVEPSDDDLVRRGDVFAVVQMMLEQFNSTENDDLRAGLHSMITDIPALTTPPDAVRARLRERVDAEAREIIDELRAYGEVASIPVYATQRARDFLQRTSAEARLAQAERVVTEDERAAMQFYQSNPSAALFDLKRRLAQAERVTEFLTLFGNYALLKGEEWRTGRGAELMDAYSAATE